MFKHKEVFQKLLNREPDSHKYQFGHVLVVGGSPGMVGAPFLAAMASLRTGAGLVTIASQKEVIDGLEKRVEEVMTLTVPSKRPLASVKEFIKDRKVSTLVIGPGMNSQSASFIRQVIKSTNLPMVIDGGGLSALQGHLEILELGTSENFVLTPHVGEFQKLYIEQLPKDRPKLKPIAKEFAQKYSIHLVLKGEPSYVAHPDGSVYENPTGNPGLATAGTGDVLAGIIGGIIAQGVELNKATEAAVYLHGLAADIAVRAKTQTGMIASDVIEAIPEALKAIYNNYLLV